MTFRKEGRGEKRKRGGKEMRQEGRKALQHFLDCDGMEKREGGEKGDLKRIADAGSL